MATPVQPRKKGTGVRTWLLLNSIGQNQVIEAGKYSIMRRTSLPARDLRVLDPFLSYPSAVFCREKAIVVNLEHIKAIIMAKEVLLLNFKDPFVEPFVQELERRIICYSQAAEELEGSELDKNLLNEGESEQPQEQLADSKRNLEGLSEFQANERKEERKQALRNKNGSSMVLPFEFIALEACLDAACSSLDNEAKALEEEAYPVLDKLASQISTLNLERVRQMKSRLVAIVGRVQKVRDELEHLLDDDGDMKEMYLTNKLYQRYIEDSSSSDEGVDDSIYKLIPDMDDRFVPSEILPETSTSHQEITNIIQNTGDEKAKNILLSGSGRESHENNSSVRVKESNTGELEMLLEAYFVQIEGTLNKLTTLREYVDDTEDYINIMLDEKQNQLLQMGVMLTTATLLLSVSIVVAGILGMNIRIHLFKLDVQQGMPKWLWTTGATTIGIIIMYLMAIAFYKYKGYID